MKKRIVLSLMLSFITLLGFSQVVNTVKWKFSQKDLDENKIELVYTAEVLEGWHLYSQHSSPDGPQPVVFTFKNSKDFKRVGAVTESPNPEDFFDDVFGVNIKQWTGKVTFKQVIERLTNEPFVVEGTVEGQTCDDSRCIQVEEDFTFKIEAGTESIVTKTQEPNKEVIVVSDVVSVQKDTVVLGNQTVVTTTTETDVIIIPESNSVDEAKEETSLILFFFIAFGAGLLALLTPCVFPMIPMTVSFFMHGHGDKKSKGISQALIYGASIVFIYVAIGSLVALLFGADFANFMSTHWLPNILFFVIFMFFALWFFGAFEITISGGFISKFDAKADKGGFTGAFFMAFTLVLVSFSCTGPIVGMILVEAAGGEFVRPIVGMLGFALAFALPFTLFAIFPSWLSGMPKSGGWMNAVKVSLGFIELALGLKFLSIADQTYHWGILDREVYLALWIVIFALWGLYLLGKLRFSHDSPVEHVGPTRLILSIAVFSFVVYMIPGMFGAPLKALSGYMPPQTSQDFDIKKIVREEIKTVGTISSTNGNSVTGLCDVPKYNDIFHLPHGLEGYYDYDQAIACAKKQGKPVFVDFTGHGCVNCREMETRVWSDPEVLKRLKNDFIIVALYVDDKTELPENEWVTGADGKIKKTVGKKYADVQISKYKANAQPYYVLLDTNGDIMVEPKAYDLNAGNFIKFLDSGLEEFKKRAK